MNVLCVYMIFSAQREEVGELSPGTLRGQGHGEDPAKDSGKEHADLGGKQSVVQKLREKCFKEGRITCQMWLRGQVVINAVRAQEYLSKESLKFWLSAYIRRVPEKGLHSFKRLLSSIIPLEFPN